MRTYDDLLDDEDEDVADVTDDGGMPDPVDTVAGGGTRNNAVFDRIQQVRRGTANDPSTMGPPAPAPDAATTPPGATPSSPFSPTDLAAMEYAHGAQQDAGIGRALNAVAGGFGAKVDNSGYDAMASNANNTANKVMDRSSKVAQAIAGRDLKKQMLTAANDRFSRTQGEKERHNQAVEGAIRARVGAAGGKSQSTALKNTVALLEGARGNPAVQQAEKDIYASSKLKGLFNKVGDLNKLSPEMSNLAVLEVAKMASGASPDDHMLKMLDPGAFQGTLAKAWEKVTNEPSPANAGSFLKQYKDYADSMTEDARQLVKDRYGRIIDANGDELGEKNRATLTKNYLHRFDSADGAEPAKVLAKGAPDGSLIPSAGAADAPSGKHKDDDSAVQWAKENSDDPMARQILQLNGVK